MSHNRIKTMNLLGTINFGLENKYKLTVMKGDSEGNPLPGTERDLTDWFNNLITDTGMERFGIGLGGDTSMSTNWGRGCRVGSGSAAPDITNTNLQSIVATTITKQSITYSRQISVLPYYVERTIVYRFATGAAAGNLAEVGLVCGTNDGSSTNGALNNATPCSTRALILDGGGNPTTVTVLSDEILDVTCKQRLYIPTADVTGTTTPTGGVAGPTDYVIRACDIDQGPSVNSGGWGGTSQDTGWDFKHRASVGWGENVVYVGASSAIGPIEGAPTGTSVHDGSGNVSTSAYVPGSNYLDINKAYSLGNANDANGIGAARVAAGACSFQIGFTPRLLKTSDMILTYTLRLTWSRYTP